MSDRFVFIGLPHNGSLVPDAIHGLLSPSEGILFTIQTSGCSLLQYNFNKLLAQARSLKDPKPTHFVLHHADIVCQRGWLNVLMSEMESHQADVISAVSPIKSEEGLTSTGAFSEDMRELKRFTMRDLAKLPETFCAPEGRALAVNTALMMVDLRQPWIKDLVFRFEDAIEENETGLTVRCRPEDWLVSEFFHRAGARVFATRKVKLAHVGVKAYSNQGDWGTLETDEPKRFR